MYHQSSKARSSLIIAYKLEYGWSDLGVWLEYSWSCRLVGGNLLLGFLGVRVSFLVSRALFSCYLRWCRTYRSPSPHILIRALDVNFPALGSHCNIHENTLNSKSFLRLSTLYVQLFTEYFLPTRLTPVKPALDKALVHIYFCG